MSSDLLYSIEEVQIYDLLQNTGLNLNVQVKFKKNVNLVVCHVFFAVLSC